MSLITLDVPRDGHSMDTALLYSADIAVTIDALLVLTHGAGAGHSSPFMVRYARGLAERGLDVVTFNFPYMAAGRRTPDRAPVLEESFRHVVLAAADHLRRGARLFIGGKSMGGRMATHLAADPESWPAGAPRLDGVVVLGYPLCPPGRSRKAPDTPAAAPRSGPDRVSHLGRLVAPALIVQGTRDSFGGPDDIRRAVGATDTNNQITIYAVQDGDHSLAVPKRSGQTQAQVDSEIWNVVVGWITNTRQTRHEDI